MEYLIYKWTFLIIDEQISVILFILIQILSILFLSLYPEQIYILKLITPSHFDHRRQLL